VKLQRIREVFDVEIHDLRKNQEKIQEFKGKGYDLNKGMVIETDERTYVGADAVYLMSVLQNNSILGTIWKTIFFNKSLTGILYPVLVIFRNSTLFILGRPKIK
jgi:hypothetical protein